MKGEITNRLLGNMKRLDKSVHCYTLCKKSYKMVENHNRVILAFLRAALCHFVLSNLFDLELQSIVVLEMCMLSFLNISPQYLSLNILPCIFFSSQHETCFKLV